MPRSILFPKHSKKNKTISREIQTILEKVILSNCDTVIYNNKYIFGFNFQFLTQAPEIL